MRNHGLVVKKTHNRRVLRLNPWQCLLCNKSEVITLKKYPIGAHQKRFRLQNFWFKLKLTFIPDRVQPSPLVWISPASLARSPMVVLRRLSTNPNEEDDESNEILERTLTMNFPARNTRRFDPLCLACFPEGQNCPTSCLSPK